MSWSPRLAIALLIGALSSSAGVALAQGDPINGWVASDDGLAFATNDTLDTPPGWTALPPGEFPPVIADLPGPDLLHQLDGTLENGDTRIASLHDGASLAWLEGGRTPVLAKAIVDDEGASWTRLQHIISTPAGCSAAATEMDLCVHPWLTTALVDLAAPADSPVTSPPFADTFEGGRFASTGVTDQPGTLFSFAGDATVGTTVKVREDRTIVVRGQADIGPGLGGRLRGYDAMIIEIPDDGASVDQPFDWESLETRSREVRATDVRPDKTNRRDLNCPPNGQGYVISQFLVNGVGRNVGPTVDSSLEGGAPVLVSEIIPFDCGPHPDPDSPFSLPEGPAAAFVCGSTRADHTPYDATVNGEAKTYASSLAELFAVLTIGLPPETAASLNGRIGGANDGHPFSVELEGIQLDSVSGSDVTFWLGESEVGIDDFGSKRFRELELAAGDLTFDLLDQKREHFGGAFKVGSSEKPSTNCPGFDFSFEDLGEIFPDGFESGDVSAWSYTDPD